MTQIRIEIAFESKHLRVIEANVGLELSHDHAIFAMLPPLCDGADSVARGNSLIRVKFTPFPSKNFDQNLRIWGLFQNFALPHLPLAELPRLSGKCHHHLIRRRIAGEMMSG
jgi:hypothetical protein